MSEQRRIESHEIFVGARVSWLHVPRGGYGYTYPVDATVTARNPLGDRVRIAVRTRTGATVERTVQTCNLRWRQR